MTDVISVKSINASKAKIDGELHFLEEINNHFSFRPKGYRYMPSFRAGTWSGFIHLFSARTRTLPVGLIPLLHKYAKTLGCEIDYSQYDNKSGFPDVTLEEVQSFADSLNIHSGGKKITPHDYQIDAVYKSIKAGRLVAIAPTSAGKSLILYIYMNWFRQNPDNKMLLIVPSVSLVHQIAGDFVDYASHIDENPEAYCHLITAGKEKPSNKPITISTFQSLAPLVKAGNTKFFEEFTVVACDETHLAKSKSISSVLDLCTNAYTRLGVTGTLDGTELMAIELNALIGEIYVVTTTKALMDRGAVSKMDIKCLMLTYPPEIKSQCSKLTYQEEIDFVVTYPDRLRFVTNLANKLTGNTLILTTLVGKHGLPLFNAIKEKVKDGRKVFFIHGGIDGEDRDAMRKIIEKETDAIIVGSYSCLSTGVSIKRLHNVIFASPSKSQVRVLQSLGRGLRLGEGKSHCTLYDIGDDLSKGKHKNYTLLHAVERIKMYATQQFEYKLIKVML